MLAIEAIQEGVVLRLPHVEREPALPGCRNIPAGLFRVVRVRASVCPPIGKPEWDTVAEVVKVSKDGKQIGKYHHDYALHFFMEHATIAKETT